MFIILKLSRTYIGGKTEVGMIVASIATLVYLLPVARVVTWDIYQSVLELVALVTGVAFLSRVENKKGVLNAGMSLLDPSIQKVCPTGLSG